MNFLNIEIFIPEMGSHLTFVVFLLRFVLFASKEKVQIVRRIYMLKVNI